MIRLPGFLLLLAFSVSLNGQQNSDFGIFGGTSSYFGDINQERLFYSPMPAGGFFYRYNLHPRQAIRGSLLIGGLRADDLDFGNDFQRARAASFSGQIGEFAVQFEFNFLPYSTQGRKDNFTAYIASGAGIVFINTASSTYEPVIPFSLGFKVNIYKNIGLEAEIGFRKTFYDNFDGLTDEIDPSHKPWLHNNDWYSFAGIALTWKMFNRMVACPTYEDVDARRSKR